MTIPQQYIQQTKTDQNKNVQKIRVHQTKNIQKQLKCVAHGCSSTVHILIVRLVIIIRIMMSPSPSFYRPDVIPVPSPDPLLLVDALTIFGFGGGASAFG
jgi:hypothetical protein